MESWAMDKEDVLLVLSKVLKVNVLKLEEQFEEKEGADLITGTGEVLIEGKTGRGIHVACRWDENKQDTLYTLLFSPEPENGRIDKNY